jgi:hypothetical protein
MGQKMFINNTTNNISVQLQVRRGDTPGHKKYDKDFSMSQGQHEMVSYSESSDPYLDGICVNTIDNGEIIATQQFVISRGSPLDDDFNTNDTVTFTMAKENIILAFSNTWTR